MKQISTDILCPSCSGPLHPRVLECRGCDIKIEGQFEGSEFDNLSSDEFHFLRIFISCEGRIRDMESALGVSYPTVKARLNSLKERLGLSGEADASSDDQTEPEAVPDPEGGDPAEDTPDTQEQQEEDLNISSLLESMEKGEIGFDEAMTKLKDGR